MAHQHDQRKPSHKEQFWRDMLQRWHRSRQTIRDFCAEHHLSEPSFYAWRTTIAQRDKAKASPAKASSPPSPDGENLPAFVPVHVRPANTTVASLELVVGTGRVVRIPTGFDADTLRHLLAVLEETPTC
jgi:hypothetical protein